MIQVIDIRKKLPWHPTRKWPQRKVEIIDTIVCHCTASDNQDPYKTNEFHITPGKDNLISQAGCPHIAYHYYITADGTIYQCNSLEDWTWHAGNFNKRSIGIVMAYAGKQKSPPVAQYNAMVQLAADLANQLDIDDSRIFGHRELPGMSTVDSKGRKKYKKWCPGEVVNCDKLRVDIAQARKVDLATYNSDAPVR